MVSASNQMRGKGDGAAVRADLSPTPFDMLIACPSLDAGISGATHRSFCARRGTNIAIVGALREPPLQATTTVRANVVVPANAAIQRLLGPDAIDIEML